jgi:hypothetical protein
MPGMHNFVLELSLFISLQTGELMEKHIGDADFRGFLPFCERVGEFLLPAWGRASHCSFFARVHP